MPQIRRGCHGTRHIFFCARDVVEECAENGNMEMQEFHCDREKMDRDIATINDLLQKSKKWVGGELRHSEEHYCCQEYKDWEVECTEFLSQFNANTKLWNDEVVLKSTCAKIIVSELNHLLAEIPQEVYKLRYWRLEDRARYSL